MFVEGEKFVFDGTKLPVNLGDPVSTLKEQRVVLEIKEPFRRVSLFYLDFFLIFEI